MFKLFACSLLPILVFSHSVQADDGDRKEFLLGLQEEDNEKRLLCGITAINGVNAHGIFKLGGAKSVAKMVMALDSYPADSLQFELIRMAIDQAFDNVPPEKISKAMMMYCMSRPFDEVSNMEDGRQKLLGMAETDEAWEEARCDDRQSNLWDAYDATDEAKIRKLLSAAKNAV